MPPSKNKKDQSVFHLRVLAGFGGLLLLITLVLDPSLLFGRSGTSKTTAYRHATGAAAPDDDAISDSSATYYFIGQPGCSAYASANKRRTRQKDWPPVDTLTFLHPKSIPSTDTRKIATQFKTTQPCAPFNALDADKGDERFTYNIQEKKHTAIPSHTITDADVGVTPSSVLIFMADNRPRAAGKAGQAYWSLTADINERYAALHGYKFAYVPETPSFLPQAEYDATWKKVGIAYEFLKNGDYDYVIYIDSDAWFTEIERPLGPLLKWAGMDTKAAAKFSDDGKTVLFSRDVWFSPSFLNTGFFVLKKSPSALEFLNRWLGAITDPTAQNWVDNMCMSSNKGGDKAATAAKTVKLSTYKREGQHEQSILSDYLIPRFYKDIKNSPISVLPRGYPFNAPAGYLVRHLFTGPGTTIINNATQRDIHITQAWMCTLCKEVKPNDEPTACPRCQDIDVGWAGWQCGYNLDLDN